MVARVFTPQPLSRTHRAQPAGDVTGIVQEDEDAGPLDSSKAEEEARVGLEEVDEQAERKVGDHEELEGVAGEKV